MARKRGGLSRFVGALAGSPYERLLKQLGKLEDEFGDDEGKLAKRLGRFVDTVQEALDGEEIDAEEHDLLMEAIEEIDPDGRTFDRYSDDGDEFYNEDMPSGPEPDLGRRKNLDQLMSSTKDSFMGSFARDEFDEFRAKISEEFQHDADEAVRAGDHQAAVLSDARVFADADEELENVKRQIAIESGLGEPESAKPAEEEDDDGITVDEDGVEWYEDEEGSWCYREPDAADWVLYEE
jgi:hypothetical protein